MNVEQLDLIEPAVAKFGGSSAARPDVIQDRIAENDERWPVVVVSAPGATPNNGVKQTPMLLELDTHDPGSTAAQTIVEAEIERFEEIYSALVDPLELGRLHDWTRNALKHYSRFPGMVPAIGEAASAKYLAAATGRQAFVPVFDDRYHWRDFPVALNDSGGIDYQISMQRTQALVQRLGQVIVPGFIVFDTRGKIRTLPRGGSDETGGVIAQSLGLQYENWTDVSGVYSTNPKQGGIQRSNITHDEARANAVAGVEVLQGDTILDMATIARLQNSPVVKTIIRNTFDPAGEYTCITETRNSSKDPSLVWLVGSQDVMQFTVNDMGASDTSGWIERLAHDFGGSLNVQHVSTGRDGVSFFVSVPDPKELDTCAVLDRLNQDLSVNGSITTPSISTVVTLVGEQLRDPMNYTRVVAGAMGALAAAGIPVQSQFRQDGTVAAALSVAVESGSEGVDVLHESLVR